MERLNWRIRQEQNGEVIEYRAVFCDKLTDSIEVLVHYNLYKSVVNGKYFLWYLGMITSSFVSFTCPFKKECYDFEAGKRMAEEELQKILDETRELLDEDGMKEVE